MNLDQGHHAHDHSSNGSAAARTVAMFPALAAPNDNAEPVEQPPVAQQPAASPATTPSSQPPHLAEVRAVLIAATDPLSVDQIQAELNGDGRPHVAEGQIVACLDALGATVAKTTVDGKDLFAMAQTAAATMARARAVIDIVIRSGSMLSQIEQKLSDAGTPYPQAKVIQDLDTWIAAGIIEKRETALEPLYQVVESYCVASDNAALDSLMRIRFPESFVDYEALAKKTEKALAAERDAHAATKRTLGTMSSKLGGYAAWFRTNGLPDPMGAPTTPREVVMWSRQRKVDGKELRRLVDERHKLKAHREALVSRFDAAKAGHKEALERVDAAISAVEEAERSSSHLLSKQVYKVIEDGKIAVYSAETHDEGTLLEREDVPTPVAQTSAPPLIQPTEEIAEEAGKIAASIAAPDAAVQAAANAANDKAEKAKEVKAKGGPKGEINLERYINEASTLLQTKGAHGLSEDDAPHDIAGCIYDRVREGHKTMARHALAKLIEQGKVIERRGRVIWAELAEPDDGSDEDEGPTSGEQ